MGYVTSVKDQNGNPLKEWYAISDYLKNMGETVDEKYSSPDDRKIVYKSLNPIKLLRNPNIFTLSVFTLFLILVTVVIIIIRRILKKKYGKVEETE